MIRGSKWLFALPMEIYPPPPQVFFLRSGSILMEMFHRVPPRPEAGIWPCGDAPPMALSTC